MKDFELNDPRHICYREITVMHTSVRVKYEELEGWVLPGGGFTQSRERANDALYQMLKWAKTHSRKNSNTQKLKGWL